MERNRTMTGARARVLWDGKKIGWATDVRAGDNHDYRPAVVLDELYVAEHVLAGYTAHVSMGMLFLIGRALRDLGLTPAHGATSQDHLRNALALGELTIAILDNQTSEVIGQVLGVKVRDRDVTFQAGNLVGMQVVCVCRELRDTADLA